MTSKDPWDREGVEPAVREAVERAARDAGLTVGEWLHARAQEPGSADLPSDMTDILRRIESIDRRSTLAISGIDQTVLGLIRRLDLSEEDLVSHVESQDGRLDQVETRLGSIADDLEAAQKRYTQSALKERLRPIEKALSDLATHLESSETRNRGSITAIETGLAELGGRVGGLEGNQESELGSLRTGLESLTERVDLVDRRRTALLRSLEVTVTDLAARLDDADADTARTAQKLEAAVDEIGRSVDAQRKHTHDALEGLEKGLQRLTENADATRAIAEAAVKPEELKAFEGDLTDRLRTEIDRAIDRTVQEFDARIEASAKRQFDAIEEIDERTGEMLARAERGLESSRDSLVARIDALEAGAGTPAPQALAAPAGPDPAIEARVSAMESETRRQLDAIESALEEIRGREARDADELRDVLTQNTTRMAGFKAQLDDLTERLDRQDAESPPNLEAPETAAQEPASPHAETTKRLEEAAEEIHRAQSLAAPAGAALYGFPGTAGPREDVEAEAELEEFLSDLGGEEARSADDEEILIEVDEAGTISGARFEGPPQENLEDADFEDLIGGNDDDEDDEEDEDDFDADDSGIATVPFPGPERGTAERLIAEADAAEAARGPEEDLTAPGEEPGRETAEAPPPPGPEGPAESDTEAREDTERSDEFLAAARRAAEAVAGTRTAETAAAPAAASVGTALAEDRPGFPFRFFALAILALVGLVLLVLFNRSGETPPAGTPPEAGTPEPTAKPAPAEAPKGPDAAKPASPAAGENAANTPQGDPGEFGDFPVNRNLTPPVLPKDPLAGMPGLNTRPGAQPAEDPAQAANPAPAAQPKAPDSSPEPSAGPSNGAANGSPAPSTPAPDVAGLAGAPAAQGSLGTPAATPAPAPAEPERPAQPLSRQAAAEAGDARAQYLLAAEKLDASGTPDPAEAAKWLSRAAGQGFTPAEYRLGRLYETGQGVGRNPARAAELYQKAADGGNRKAMHNLAYLYALGTGVRLDYAKAASLFREAADLGLTDSQFNLGLLYEDGLGVPSDLKEAYKWFSIAAKNGDAQAARKRDDVGRLLKPNEIQSLRNGINAWSPKPIDAEANGSFDTGSAASTRDVARVQDLLNQVGFSAGTPDGVMGPRTAAAIRAFEASAGIRETGRVSAGLLEALERAASGRQG